MVNVLLLNVPVPDVDQLQETALPPNAPDKVCVNPEQTLESEPALAVAADAEATVTDVITGEQAEAWSVTVTVYVPGPADREDVAAPVFQR